MWRPLLRDHQTLHSVAGRPRGREQARLQAALTTSDGENAHGPDAATRLALSALASCSGKHSTHLLRGYTCHAFTTIRCTHNAQACRSHPTLKRYSLSSKHSLALRLPGLPLRPSLAHAAGQEHPRGGGRVGGGRRAAQARRQLCAQGDGSGRMRKRHRLPWCDTRARAVARVSYALGVLPVTSTPCELACRPTTPCVQQGSAEATRAMCFQTPVAQGLTQIIVFTCVDSYGQHDGKEASVEAVEAQEVGGDANCGMRAGQQGGRNRASGCLGYEATSLPCTLLQRKDAVCGWAQGRAAGTRYVRPVEPEHWGFLCAHSTRTACRCGVHPERKELGPAVKGNCMLSY